MVYKRPFHLTLYINKFCLLYYFFQTNNSTKLPGRQTHCYKHGLHNIVVNHNVNANTSLLPLTTVIRQDTFSEVAVLFTSCFQTVSFTVLRKHLQSSSVLMFVHKFSTYLMTSDYASHDLIYLYFFTPCFLSFARSPVFRLY